MGKKHNIAIILCSIILTAIIIAGVSYAYYMTVLNKTDDSTVIFSTKELALNFSDGPQITMPNAVPGQKVIKTFSVTNTGNQTVNYTIEFYDVLYEFIRHDFAFSLTATNGGFEIDKFDFWGDVNPIIGSAEIAPGVTQEYTFTLEFRNYPWSQSADMNKTIAFSIGISETIPVYGIKYDINGQYGIYSNRTDAAMGINMEYSTANHEFDHIYPWSDIISYNYDPVTQTRTATYGDENFKFDGSNGLVMTYIPEFYYKRYIEDGYLYMKISKYPIEGFLKSEAFSVSRYLASWNGTSLESKSGAIPENAHVIDWYRSRVSNLGSKFSLLDYHLFYIQMLYAVEYNEIRGSWMYLGRGYTNWEQYQSLVAMNNSNQFVVNGYGFEVGDSIAFGTSQYFNDIVTNRTIIAKEAYDSGGITGYLYTFDGDPVDITTSMNVHHISHKTGTTDSLGMSSSAIAYGTSVTYRGIEDIYGNGWTFVDGITSTNYIVSICTDYTKYSDDVNNTCNQVTNIEIPHSTGFLNYLSYDGNYPYILLPTGTLSSTSSFDRVVIGDSGRKVLIYGGVHGGNYHGMFTFGFDISAYYFEASFAGTRLLLHEE